MADDPSPVIIRFNGNMETIMDEVLDIITEEDVLNNTISDKLFELRDYYMELARENFTDSDALDKSICAQELLVAHRGISYDYKKRKPILYNSFNDYYNALSRRIRELSPSRGTLVFPFKAKENIQVHKLVS